MKVQGGTVAPGVAPDAFSMPDGMAMRYDRPARDLAGCVTGYTVYHAGDAAERTDWFLPAPAMLCVFVGAGPITVRIGNHQFGPLADTVVIGPTTRAMRVVTHGGTLVGIGISAEGWARMTDRSASPLHNRIVPADTVIDPDEAAALVADLSALPDDGGVKSVLDAALRRLMRPVATGARAQHLPLIARLTELAAVDGANDVREIAELLDVAEARLRRLSRHYFGMPPKTLLRRARFLRAFVRMFGHGDVEDARSLDPSYFDISHYLRDANAFLGTTPRRFLMQTTPFLVASIRARAAVLGAPTQALHSAGQEEDAVVPLPVVRTGTGG